MSRSSSTMALPPHAYGPPKGSYWRGLGVLDRYPTTAPERDELLGEHMSMSTRSLNKSLAPSRDKNMSKSTSLLELHYETMRKKQQERESRPGFINGPTMDRPWAAISGYSGFIPGKLSNNVCGCTFSEGSRQAFDATGKFYEPPMSGFEFTLGKGSPSRSQSLPGPKRRTSATSELTKLSSNMKPRP